MIILQGKGSRCCDHIDRRDFLRVGGLGAFGLSVDGLLRTRAAQAMTMGGGGKSSFGRAHRIILLFMMGGPAHQDTFDLKPDAPSEVRGEFKPISTNVPGIQISEYFPLLARMADQYTIIRSVTHPSNAHSASAHHMLTGNIHPNPAGENLDPRPTDFPHIGSVITKLRPNTNAIPTFVALPWKVANTGGEVWPGQGGGFLGAAYDPFRVNIPFERLKNDVHKYENLDFRVSDLILPEGVTLPRIESRRRLLENLTQGLRAMESIASMRNRDTFYSNAFDLVTSPQAQKAFDINQEPITVRERYGRHIFGQGVLLARRLSEAGVPLITVYWHQDGTAESPGWDTHVKNFSHLRERLMPPTDVAFSALLDDLHSRGLLDETLVVWMGEFGRTPKITSVGGRDHWGACQSVVIAGAGIRGGQVIGSSDAQAAYPAENPISPDDLAATIYHLLGVDHNSEIRDQLDRPVPASRGRVLHELF